jgi:hypothetical protein
MAASALLQSLLYPKEKKTAETRAKANAYLLNPFLKRDGTLANKHIDYQAVLSNPGVSDKVKRYVTEATGLGGTTPSAATKGTVNVSANAGGTPAKSAVGAAGAAGAAPAVKAAFNGKIGSISAKYEAGGWNPGRVSSGTGDYGGVSYGMPQFSTTTGSAKSFVNWLKKNNPDMGNIFADHAPGSAEFSAAWKNAAAQYGDTFGSLQNQYVYNNMVAPFIARTKEKTGVDLNATPALRELAFSTAVQFGGGGVYALGNINPKMSEKDIINSVYDNKINKVAVYFRGSSKDVQNGVKNRFINERKDLLALTN